jgi:hypothetical protein
MIVITEVERRQIAWYYYESELSINEIAIMYESNPLTVRNFAEEYQEWYT